LVIGKGNVPGDFTIAMAVFISWEHMKTNPNKTIGRDVSDLKLKSLKEQEVTTLCSQAKKNIGLSSIRHEIIRIYKVNITFRIFYRDPDSCSSGPGRRFWI
jgi:hypothetical protein